MKSLPVLTLTLTLLLGTAVYAEPCSITYRPNAVGVVHGADLIVRAANRGYLEAPANENEWTTGTPDSELVFDVVEVLKGDRTLTQVILNGYEGRVDDFNDRPVPYDFVRPGGRGGSCFANTYKVGAEFLLMLRYSRTLGTYYTVNWYALGPVNEQLRSAEDPWLLWVREELETWDGLQNELADAQTRWRSNRPGAYEFTVDVRCSCPASFRVTDGRPEQIGDAEPVSDRYQRYDTVEELFVEVRRLIAARPERLLIRYDNQFGFPAMIDMMIGFHLDTLEVSVWGFKGVEGALQPI